MSTFLFFDDMNGNKGYFSSQKVMYLYCLFISCNVYKPFYFKNEEILVL
jgi:hypothetical protein